MPDITFRVAQWQDKAVLSRLLELYQYDLPEVWPSERCNRVDVKRGPRLNRWRQVLAALARLLLAFAGVAVAAPRTIAVVSLIGDKLEVVVPQMTTGSHIDRNRRAELGDRAGAFDQLTLKAAADAIAAVDLGIGTVLISVPPSNLHDRPEQLFDGKQVALPGAIVDELDRVGAHYLILITKRRDDVQVPFVNAREGIGKVRGLGFYADAEQRVRLVDGGDTGQGFLAPFAYFQLSLVDVRTGLVVREQKVTRMETLPSVAFGGGVDPWDVLDAARKVERLQGLIRQGMADGIRPLLQGL